MAKWRAEVRPAPETELGVVLTAGLVRSWKTEQLQVYFYLHFHLYLFSLEEWKTAHMNGCIRIDNYTY